MTANSSSENQNAAASTQDVRGSGLSVASGSASEDIFNSEQYQKFVDSMTHHCRCTGQPRPCDGVLAGGLCDNIHDERGWGDDDIMDEHLENGGSPC